MDDSGRGGVILPGEVITDCFGKGEWYKSVKCEVRTA